MEVCPASNALTLGLRSLHHHPTLSPWLQAGYPLALCTDDPGVFGVTLSGEYADVAEAHGLPRERVAALALAAFEHAFVDAPTKARLVAAATATVRALLASQPPGCKPATRQQAQGGLRCETECNSTTLESTIAADRRSAIAASADSDCTP